MLREPALKTLNPITACKYSSKLQTTYVVDYFVFFERDMRLDGDKEALLIARGERRALSLNILLVKDKEEKDREDDNFVIKKTVQNYQPHAILVRKWPSSGR